MTVARRDANCNKRTFLRANWLLCATPAGDSGHFPLPDDSSWFPIRELMPAAAALRELKQWSIDDPARRFDAQDWWYKLAFDAPPDACPGDRLVLGFDGLATLAQVWLNGAELLRTANMFISHECDVSHALESTGNELLIRFSALDTELAVRRKRPRWRAPMVEHQQLRWFRTTLLGRTPGWSPPAAVVGPWKDVWLGQRNQIEVKDMSLAVRVEGNAGSVECQLQVEAPSERGIVSVHLEVARNKRIFVTQLTCNPASVEIGSNTFGGELHISDVDLWWPHTHGTPALYRAVLRIRLADHTEEVTVDLGRLGFRTIALDTANGNFSLSVNGVPVFCRGACWTPLDPVMLRSPPQDCAAAIAQARDAGMNMLRVSGTMVYEEDHFFDACDEQGMLVWQDFMFANMDYPTEDAAFMASALVEVRQQLNRLQSRACLALLCGNSEVEQQAAMWGAPRGAWQSPFFGETLAGICSQVIADTPYWPSSAHGGSFPHQANAGTTSYYGIGAYLRNFEDARLSNLKFATECLAFANIPSPSCIERMPGGSAIKVHHPAWKARVPRDLGAGWDFDDVRDHYMKTLFKTDPQKLRHSDHDRYLTLSRVTTGEIMASTVAEWRRPASSCNGAMILFLRDLWAGAGWGLVDDTGAPKACYHYVKRALQPLTAFFSDEGVNGIFVHVVNDRNEKQHLELDVTAWRDGDVLVATGIKVLTVPGHSNTTLACLDLFEHFMDLNYAYRFGPINCDAVVLTLTDQRGAQTAQAFYFPSGLNTDAGTDVGLWACTTMLDAQTAEVTVRTRKLAQSVHFDVPGFDADNDYFHLAPNAEIRVTLRSNGCRALMGWVTAVNSVKGARVDASASIAVGHGEEAVL